MSLSLKLLGGFSVHDASGAVLSLPTRKTRALLSYLAVNVDRPQPRERLMALLWSERGEHQARHSLNQGLVAIRRLDDAKGATLLDSDGEWVTLRGDSMESDVKRFRALIQDDPAEAAILYDGPFLDGLSVPAPAFENWLLATRSELQALACNALENAAESSQDTKTASDSMRRLLALDPLREDVHRRLMRLLHELGDRAGALRQYQACTEVLKRELQVEPDIQTKELFEAIKNQTIRSATGAVLSQASKALPTNKPAPLPDKPSIAVLPFCVLGGDPEAVILAEGLTEDLISSLAKVPELFVIASNSTAVYKGKAVEVQHVAKALGVRYVLEGSVQKSAERVRVTPQLIDARSGGHLWAERYDRPMEDVFALQDEIVRHVLIELQVRLVEGESARIASRGTRSLQAWLALAQGYREGNKFTRESIIRARGLYEAAHEADPNWARPFAAIGWSHLMEAQRDWGTSREESIRLATEFSEKAIAMDPKEPLGYQNLHGVLFLRGEYDQGIALAEKAVTLAPNDFMALASLGFKLLLVDEFDRALEIFERVRQLCPILPDYQLRRYGLLLQLSGECERAIEVLEGLTRSAPTFLYGHAQLAAAYADAGQLEAARSSVETVLERDPGFNTTQYLNTLPFKNRVRLETLRDLLIKAGLPE